MTQWHMKRRRVSTPLFFHKHTNHHHSFHLLFLFCCLYEWQECSCSMVFVIQTIQLSEWNNGFWLGGEDRCWDCGVFHFTQLVSFCFFQTQTQTKTQCGQTGVFFMNEICVDACGIDIQQSLTIMPSPSLPHHPTINKPFSISLSTIKNYQPSLRLSRESPHHSIWRLSGSHIFYAFMNKSMRWQELILWYREQMCAVGVYFLWYIGTSFRVELINMGTLF